MIDYKLSDIVYKENQYIDYIYLIMEGEVEQSRIYLEEMDCQQQYDATLKDIRKVQKKKAPLKKRIVVAILGKYQYFGQEEVLRETKFRDCQIKCLSDCKILRITKNNFNRFFVNNKESFENIQSHQFVKDNR